MEVVEWVQIVIAVVIATISSTGFWKWMETKDNRKSMTDVLLLGMAHDRIVSTGLSYISRGWVTKDEYEDFIKYLYDPYISFGGNGLSERIYKDLQALPILGMAPEKGEKNEQRSVATIDE